MRTARFLRLAVLVSPLALAACNNGSSSGNTGFDPLVTELIEQHTNETGAPIETEGKTFVFPTDDTAFDDVLPPDTGAIVH